LISTHDLYQDFVDACLSYISRDEDWKFTSEPPTHVSTTPSNLTAYPDHVLQTSQGDLLLDSKYVVSADWDQPDNRGERRPDLSEVYQVMAAGRAREIEDVGLVYPSVSDQYTGPWSIQGAGNPLRIHLVEIDPSSFKFRNIERFTESIQTEIHSIVHG
jgi:5-methylcytosine-specific restriction endonuclease McrBC regulatory subunit McrC